MSKFDQIANSKQILKLFSANQQKLMQIKSIKKFKRFSKLGRLTVCPVGIKVKFTSRVNEFT